jgi:hypothetical protein
MVRHGAIGAHEAGDAVGTGLHVEAGPLSPDSGRKAARGAVRARLATSRGELHPRASPIALKAAAGVLVRHGAIGAHEAGDAAGTGIALRCFACAGSGGTPFGSSGKGLACG